MPHYVVFLLYAAILIIGIVSSVLTETSGPSTGEPPFIAVVTMLLLMFGALWSVFAHEDFQVRYFLIPHAVVILIAALSIEIEVSGISKTIGSAVRFIGRI